MPSSLNRPSIAVYLGSGGKARSIFKDACANLGRALADHQYNLVYGGMNAGLMGIVAQSSLDHGGHVTGVIPRRLQDSERAMDGLSDTVWTGTLSERKFDMFCRSNAFVIMPGGFGTLDEALEVLYWHALGHHDKPLYFVNIDGYWDDIIALFNIFPAVKSDFFNVFDTIDALCDHLHTIFHEPSSWNHKDMPPNDDPLPHFEDEVTSGDLEHILVEKPLLADLTRALTALGLKQLDKHQTPIGFLNTDNQFDPFFRWIKRAAQEHFITAQCQDLFCAADTRDHLMQALAKSTYTPIDLQADKWGDS